MHINTFCKNIMKIIAKNNTFLPALSATRKQFTSVEFASSRSPTTTSRFGQKKTKKHIQVTQHILYNTMDIQASKGVITN